jgi:hypothetical protein
VERRRLVRCRCGWDAADGLEALTDHVVLASRALTAVASRPLAAIDDTAEIAAIVARVPAAQRATIVEGLAAFRDAAGAGLSGPTVPW